MSDEYEICPSCYGTMSKNHHCGPKTLAKDDLCLHCNEILEDCTRAIFHYAKDMLSIERILTDEEQPHSLMVEELRQIMKRRADRILREMQDGRIKRT